MVELREYIDRQGRNAIEKWFYRLDDVTQARVTILLNRLRHGGTAAKGVGAGVLELRLDHGPGYRIYFGRDGETLVILLAGGTKKRQQSDIAAAQALWNEYKQRKRGNDAVDERLQRNR